MNGTDVDILELKYKLSSDIDSALLDSCTSCYLSDEQKLSLTSNISEIVVCFEIDKAWGFIKPISINGYKVLS